MFIQSPSKMLLMDHHLLERFLLSSLSDGTRNKSGRLVKHSIQRVGSFDLKLEMDRYLFKTSQINTDPNAEARRGFNESVMYLLPKDGGTRWRNFSLSNNLRLPGRKNQKLWTSPTVGQMEI